MNTTENNKKIAEFMGWKNHLKNGGATLVYKESKEHVQDWEYFDKEKELLITPIEMRYHSDWNWLMEVVEKIEQTETKDGRTFTIDMHKDNVIIHQYGKYNNEIIVTGGGTRIENLYNACIEFVEWYNKEQIIGGKE